MVVPLSDFKIIVFLQIVRDTANYFMFKSTNKYLSKIKIS